MKALATFTLLIFISVMITEGQYKLTNYTDANQINQLVEEGDHIWVCTSGGVYKRRKSDGSLVTTFNVSNSGIARNTIQSMYIDFYGNYWFGAGWGGISRFDGNAWNTIRQVDGFQITACPVITSDINGNMWFGINQGRIIKYDGKKYTLYNLNANWEIGSILSDDEGNLWIGAAGIQGKCWKMDPEGVIELIPGPGNDFITNGVYAIEKDRNGKIWFATYNAVYRYDPITGIYQDMGEVGGMNYAISQDGNGNMWVSTSSGMFRFNGSNWTQYLSGETTDRANMALDVLADAQGNIWIGGYNGLAKVNLQTATPLTNGWTAKIKVNALTSNYVETMTFTADGKAKLFGQFQYMIRYNGTTWSDDYANGGCIFGWVKNSVTDVNNISWIAYLGYSDKLLKVIKYPVTGPPVCYSHNVAQTVDWPDGFVTDMTYDQKNNQLWISTENGLFRFNISNSTFTHLTSPTYNLPGNKLTGITARGGIIWYSSNNGIGSYNTGTNSFLVRNTSHGLPSNGVGDIIFDRNGLLWMSSGSYLTSYNGTSFRNHIPPVYPYILAVDSLNNIWGGGYGGGFKYTGGDFASFTTEEGLNENYINKIVVSPTNEVWFCSGFFGITKITSDKPEPDFTTGVSCLPDQTTLTNTSAKVNDLTRFEWDINNDGSVEYGTKDLIHQFTSPGQYSIKLTAWNDLSKAEIIKTIYVNEKPDVILNYSHLESYCAGERVGIRGFVKNMDSQFTYSYLWNNGQTANTIHTDTSGVFWVDVAAGGCTGRSDTAEIIFASPFNGEQICMVTVDPIEKKNMIVWSKTPEQGIESYNIYKLFGSNLVPIGNVPFGKGSFYIDYTSVPEALAARYAITAVDTCGNESLKSPYHQTIQLGASLGAQPNTIVLNWSAYMEESKAFNPSWFYIFRGSNPLEMQLHDSVPSSFTAWNDINPGDNRYYQIGVKKDTPCFIMTDIGKKASGGPFIYSLSNLEDNKLKTGISAPSARGAIAYPNPFDNEIRITWPNDEALAYKIVLTDIRGVVVKQTDPILAGEYLLQREGLEPGVYIIRIEGKTNHILRVMAK